MSTNLIKTGEKENKIHFYNPTKQDVVLMFDGDSDRYKPKSCIKESGESCPVPAYASILDAQTNKNMAETTVVLPWWNTGSVYVEDLPAGDYMFLM